MPFTATTYSSEVLQKGAKYTSMGDNSPNKIPKIENLERDVPWCPE